MFQPTGKTFFGGKKGWEKMTEKKQSFQHNLK
jgi:hypothetical protein